MPNLVEVTYGQTGRSTNTDALGMREMQARAFAARDAQYLLVKAPPASGKSRALMFLALDKMLKQGVAKTVVAVPERSIGASFASTPLSEQGFFADWEVNPRFDLCAPGGEQGKVRQFQAFLQSDDRILVCTHATLRFACQELETSAFDIESDLNDLKATILQDDTMQKAMPGNVDPEVINKILIPKIIRTKYPDLSETEYEESGADDFRQDRGLCL